MKKIKIILGLIVSLFINTEGYGMSLFDIGKICLFSEVKGQVLLNGSPLKNIEVIRSTKFQHNKGSEVTYTNENGEFYFTTKFKNSIAKFLPVEAVILQTIDIKHNRKDYEIWRTTKRDYVENSELDGKRMNLLCELSNEPRYQTIGKHVIKSICLFK